MQAFQTPPKRGLRANPNVGKRHMGKRPVGTSSGRFRASKVVTYYREV